MEPSDNAFIPFCHCCQSANAPVFSPHCTFWMISDAQLPESLRVVHTNLAQASQFWTFWYSELTTRGQGGYGRATRHTVSVDETTTPYFLPTAVDRERGKSQEMRIPRHKPAANNHDGNITFPPDWPIMTRAPRPCENLYHISGQYRNSILRNILGKLYSLTLLKFIKLLIKILRKYYWGRTVLGAVEAAPKWLSSLGQCI